MSDELSEPKIMANAAESPRKRIPGRRKNRKRRHSAMVSAAKKSTSKSNGIMAQIVQQSDKVIMIKVLRDIKRELAEQKVAAREAQLSSSDGDSTSHVLLQSKSREELRNEGSDYTGSSRLSDSDADSAYGPIEFEERQRPVPKLTILHYSPFKAVWDWIVLLLVLYTAVFTPYIVAFLVNQAETLMNLNDDQHTRLKNAKYDSMDPLVIVDLFVDLMFIADIIINFRTTFVQGGEVVSNSKKIAIHYLKGWFIIDAVAAIPFDLLFFGSGTSDTLTATGVLKLARLLRLLRVVRRADQYSQYAAATLLLMLISFAMIAHWLACIFYAVAYMERKTLPEPISWLDQLAGQMQMPYLANDTTSGPDLRSRYITSLYFTMTTLTSIGFGNVAPNTKGEKIFSIFAMMIGALMSAAIFGNFSSIMMRMYQGSEEMQQKTRSITDFIKFHLIPTTLSKRMHEAFLHSWSDTNGVDMNSVLKSFPEQIQADICLHLNKNLLSNNIAFKGASPGCLRALSLRFTTTHAPPGDNLIHLGDIVNSVYFIARGTIEILKDDVCMAILGRGDIFGVSVDDLCSVIKSNYSVHALTFCDMNKIDAYDLQDIFDMYPEFTDNFKKKFALTFDLKMAEYKTLVTPQDMDEETIKLIRQKRPKMQCRGPPSSQILSGDPSQDELITDLSPAMSASVSHHLPVGHHLPGHSLHEADHESPSHPQRASIELTPVGSVTYSPAVRRKDLTHHQPSAIQEEATSPTELSASTKPVKHVKLTTPAEANKSEKESAAPTFRSIILMAAKVQKEKDLEEERQREAQVKEESQAELPITPVNQTYERSEEEKQHLQSISDRIDECMARAVRVETQWDESVKQILALLGHNYSMEKKTYV